MAVAFSSSEEEVINRKVEAKEQLNIGDYDVYDFYEIEKCVEWIKKNNFLKVTLQFPDGLLNDAAEVALILKKETQVEIYILGDTSYGSCCVDEIAAEHVSADAILHFGHACLSPTNRLPVLYIFGKLPIHVENVLQEFSRLFTDKESYVIVFCDGFYNHILEKLKEELEVNYKNLIFAEHHIPRNSCCSNTIVKDSDSFKLFKKCGQTFYFPKEQLLSSYNMFYIGSEQQTLMNLMLSFSSCKFYSYNPCTKVAREETLDINKYLRKRYYCIEKAKDARIIGILVGTLGVSNYLSIINHLQTIAKSAGKKTYTLVVGKLNSAKLANFPEIEVFVYVSCPECSVVESHEFYQPIVTPFELEIACNQARSWTGDYITDFSELLPGASSYVPLNIMQDAVGDVSLITGKFRSFGSTSVTEDEDICGSAVVKRDNMTVMNIHSNAAGEHLAGRSWRGLELCLGETEVLKAVEGKKGIACSYEGEGEESK